MKWVFSSAEMVSPDEIYKEPDSRPSMAWLVRELGGWLKSRGLEAAGKKKELLERVLEYYDREEYRTATRVRGGTVELFKK
jgi:hypothetical protein